MLVLFSVNLLGKIKKMLSKLTYKLISEIGVKEKYIRKDHYNTLKVWWARRPITTMRSLLIKEILKRNNESEALIDTHLFLDVNPSPNSFKGFQEKYSTENISVLDVFAGGGSIPFESARLGFKTYASELNPVASLLQETIFHSQSIKEYSEKLQKAGLNIIDRVESKIGQYYDISGVKPYVIFWSKVAKCKRCGADLDLRRMEYLSKRKNKPLRVIEKDGKLHLSNSLEDDKALQKEFLCVECGTSHSFRDIKDYCKTNKLNHSPFAICYHSSGKKYKVVSAEDKNILNEYSALIQTEIASLSHLLPQEPVKSKGGVINPTLYDLKNPKDFFNERQLLVLLTVIDEITKEYPTLRDKHGEFEAKQIVLGLTALIEFLVDWNSVSTMWISQNEQTGRSLAGPGVGMKWDFIEVNPFSKHGSNLRSKLQRVVDTFEAIKFNNQVNIHKGSSTSLNIPDASIDIVLTDPPYYDSIDYTALSEFFRPWFEILIRNTYDSNANLKNNENFEAIVELTKGAEKERGELHYQSIMTGVLSETNRVLREDGSVLMLYSHKTFEGWKVIADSFRDAKLFVNDCIPIEMERIARPRAMSYDALNGVIVFNLKKDKKKIQPVKQDVSLLKDKISNGEILDSQVVIYLAALACKQVTLTTKSYEQCYDEVIKLYEKTRLENWINGSMDLITKSYLEAKLKGSTIDLEKDYLNVLITNDLLEGKNLKPLEAIKLNGKTKNTVLERAVNIYNDFKYNSKTKITVEREMKDNLVAFYSIVGGQQLNTVAKRSSSPETKVARLILSKVH